MPLTLLVVDDDPGTRLAISHYLEIAGYSVITAENGQEALLMVEEYQPHLMVTDIMMPKMDGYELVRQIRQRPAFRLLPVILLTARNQTQERIRGYQLGCDVFLPKPFELEELGAVIRNLLERNQLIQSEWRFSHSEPVRSLKEWEMGASASGPAVESHPAEPASPVYNGQVPSGLLLTQREQEVLDLLTIGLSNTQIGDCLHLSPRTVEKYVSNLLRKTGTSNRAELVRYAMEHRLVE